MTTNPTPTTSTERPTGAVVARRGFDAHWFHTGAKAAGTAIATYPHRRPGEDAPH